MGCPWKKKRYVTDFKTIAIIKKSVKVSFPLSTQKLKLKGYAIQQNDNNRKCFTFLNIPNGS